MIAAQSFAQGVVGTLADRNRNANSNPSQTGSLVRDKESAQAEWAAVNESNASDVNRFIERTQSEVARDLSVAIDNNGEQLRQQLNFEVGDAPELSIAADESVQQPSVAKQPRMEEVVVTARQEPDSMPWDLPDYLGTHGLQSNKLTFKDDASISINYSKKDGLKIRAKTERKVPFVLAKIGNAEIGIEATQKGNVAIGAGGISGEGELSTRLNYIKYKAESASGENQSEYSLYSQGGGSISASKKGVDVVVHSDLVGGEFKTSNDTGIVINGYHTPLEEFQAGLRFGGGWKGTVAQGTSAGLDGSISASVKTLDYSTDWGFSGVRQGSCRVSC